MCVWRVWLRCSLLSAVWEVELMICWCGTGVSMVRCFCCCRLCFFVVCLVNLELAKVMFHPEKCWCLGVEGRVVSGRIIKTPQLKLGELPVIKPMLPSCSPNTAFCVEREFSMFRGTLGSDIVLLLEAGGVGALDCMFLFVWFLLFVFRVHLCFKSSSNYVEMQTWETNYEGINIVDN